MYVGIEYFKKVKYFYGEADGEEEDLYFSRNAGPFFWFWISELLNPSISIIPNILLLWPNKIFWHFKISIMR